MGSNKMVWLWFKKVISNNEYDEEIKLNLEDRSISIHKSMADSNSVTIFGDGPDGKLKVKELWAVQRGVYHLVK